ncbi:transposase, IS605 OrfB family, central region [Mesobacillus persicus]|uniref:Transposase, IS605 OrfB family, central region n=1 Tax=Mesobacillus persicus TaxID=930146 RepID=A0A1H8D370_9BACI|nr:IS200/IS605 family accessory protein TnpB-related protein [Mesobacillus persicus]SEN01612.1 transposase, IS605 OrfB family, central region [Mesobacillus persicus]
MLQTYQTKLRNVELSNCLTSDRYLQEYSKFFGMVERKLFVQSHIHGQSSASLKKAFSKNYGLTARQFNSLRIQLDGKVSSFIEKRQVELEEVERKIQYLRKFIDKKTKQKEKLHEKILKMKQTHPRFLKQLKKYRYLKFVLHQKKRRLRTMEQRFTQLNQDREHNKIRICFGSKRLFHKQFYLDANGYATFQDWKKDWQDARSYQFMVVGSKDESFGNQSATYDLENNLRLRVADQFVEKYGKYITLPNVLFSYGQDQLDQAKISYQGITKGGKPQRYFKAISYRFIKKEKGWYVNATVDIENPRVGTSNQNGLIGVDLNAGFLSICEIDRFGNPINEWKISVPMYARNKNQIKASLSNAVQEIVHYAILVQKNIVIESLNFAKKKTSLREMGAKYARMLSGFAYASFKSIVESKAKKSGVYVQSVYPAYTSQIGHMKFMARYGLSPHGAAACMIARRGYRFKVEQPKYDSILSFPKNFNKEKSNFSNWKSITTHLKKNYSFHDKIELLKADH